MNKIKTIKTKEEVMKWKMAPQYKYNTGREDERYVFYNEPQKNFTISREYVKPRLTANNTLMGTTTKNLASVYHNCEEGYIADLKTYANRYNTQYGGTASELEIKHISSFGVFMKMMWAWYDSDPEHVDLSAVTVADIVSLDADVRTVARAIDAEFLPIVTTYDDLITGIQ